LRGKSVIKRDGRYAVSRRARRKTKQGGAKKEFLISQDGGPKKKSNGGTPGFLPEKQPGEDLEGLSAVLHTTIWISYVGLGRRTFLRRQEWTASVLNVVGR